MRVLDCITCGTTFTPTHSRNIYCRPECRQDEHRKVEKACDCCGRTCMKPPTSRYKATYCSQLCRDYVRTDRRGTSCDLPQNHWGRWYGSSSAWVRPEIPEPYVPPFRGGTCDDCGAAFVERAWSSAASQYCSTRCQRRVGRRARKAREHNAPGTYTYSQIMRQYARQGYTCAYCHEPCEGLPDPEHVVPLSKGGRNDMSNLVAACRQCNGDKRDVLLEEWNADRARRGLEPIDTSLSGPAFLHLAA